MNRIIESIELIKIKGHETLQDIDIYILYVGQILGYNDCFCGFFTDKSKLMITFYRDKGGFSLSMIDINLNKQIELVFGRPISKRYSNICLGEALDILGKY